MKAIVYTSNTGSTAQYAKLLGHELGISVYRVDEAKKPSRQGRRSFILDGSWQVVSRGMPTL